MTSSTVSKKPSNEVAEPAQGDTIEASQQSAQVGGSAGLNLNIFGALKGAFSSKTSKETDEDGSEVERKEEHAGVQGAGAGNVNANAAAGAEQQGKAMRAQVQRQ